MLCSVMVYRSAIKGGVPFSYPIYGHFVKLPFVLNIMLLLSLKK